ncbi:hypothetical protein MYAER_2073 [Microcystis aeruginosa NIES-2549]|uniref:Uncharacterized protein n=1 Tax=Microcystis aeruginosa NIES-2549 TaxID=1641812 RepID=A0A0F6U4A5_MICAE|nr:hypothetical protein MYAER_2073 [Microcystis aeruginosa NIES-2549]AOC52819.1 hypothetical protein amyaer_2100 [Microcystis aeruginosa NIES-2481]
MPKHIVFTLNLVFVNYAPIFWLDIAVISTDSPSHKDEV